MTRNDWYQVGKYVIGFLVAAYAAVNALHLALPPWLEVVWGALIVVGQQAHASNAFRAEGPIAAQYDPPSTALKVLPLALVLTLCAGAARSADAPPALSLQRLSAGVTMAGALASTPDAHATAAAPSAYVSYSLTSVLSAAASSEYATDSHAWSWRGGLRATVTPPTAHVAAALGVDAVQYGGAHGMPGVQSWSTSLRAAWVALQQRGVDRLYAIASAEYDPGQQRTTYRLGLRLPLVGGK